MNPGSLADPGYLAALEADCIRYEQATATDPASLAFSAWVDQMEAAGFCSDCDAHGPLCSGLCKACWEGRATE